MARLSESGQILKVEPARYSYMLAEAGGARPILNVCRMTVPLSVWSCVLSQHSFGKVVISQRTDSNGRREQKSVAGQKFSRPEAVSKSSKVDRNPANLR